MPVAGGIRYARKWELGPFTEPHKITKFNQLVRQAIAILGQRYQNGEEALDAWLDRVYEAELKPQNRFFRTPLQSSASYCDECIASLIETGNQMAEQRMRALKEEFFRLSTRGELFAGRIDPIAHEDLAASYNNKKLPEMLSCEVAADTAELTAPGQPQKDPLSWSDIKLVFLSEFNLQVYRKGKPAEVLNYAELGFEDHRKGKSAATKPTKAWGFFRHIAASQDGGAYCTKLASATSYASISKQQKAVQNIRQNLRRYFKIAADPVLYRRGEGYQPCFKIEISSSSIH